MCRLLTKDPYNAQLFMGRRLKTSLPTKVDLLKPQQSPEIQQHFQKRKEREKSYYDQHSGKGLPPLTPGEKVSMHHENEWIQATIVKRHHKPRSYIVQTPNGKFYRRNRRHLRMRVSQAKGTDATQIAQPQKATLPTPTSIQSRPCRPGASTDHGLPAEIRTRSGRVVKQPKYLKDYEL